MARWISTSAQKAPKGLENNWVDTRPSKGIFVWFRSYYPTLPCLFEHKATINLPLPLEPLSYSLRRVPFAFRYRRLLATGIFKIHALCPQETRHMQMELYETMAIRKSNGNPSRRVWEKSMKPDDILAWRYVPKKYTISTLKRYPGTLVVLLPAISDLRG